MECMYKLERTEEYAVESTHTIGEKKGHIKKIYFYKECAKNGCQAWSDVLQECRLVLLGVERAKEKEE